GELYPKHSAISGIAGGTLLQPAEGFRILAPAADRGRVALLLDVPPHVDLRRPRHGHRDAADGHDPDRNARRSLLLRLLLRPARGRPARVRAPPDVPPTVLGKRARDPHPL